LRDIDSSFESDIVYRLVVPSDAASLNVLTSDRIPVGLAGDAFRSILILMRFLPSAVVLCAAVLLNHSAAETVSWNTTTGDWTNAASWDPATVPTSSDDAVIDNSGQAGITNGYSSASNIFVGLNSSSSSLAISNGGTLATSSASIGYHADSSSNSVLVTGAASLWINESSLYVGESGSGNTLVIYGGGNVSNNFASIGREATASNNSALVTGAGSIWSGTTVDVGYDGSGNSLVVSNGGIVQLDGLVVGYNAGSDSNGLLLTGSNSLLSVVNDIRISYDANTGNSMTISGGATALSGAGFIGSFNEASADNSVVVNGVGSAWMNSTNLYVGEDGHNNKLVISNGGMVANVTASIGRNASASNNSVLVTGAGSTWTNTDGLLIGYEGSGNSLVISNGGYVAAGGDCVIGYFTESSGNSLLITGTNSSLAVVGGLYVSEDANAANTMTIAAGARVTSGSGSIGAYSDQSSGNSVLVTGASSTWNVSTNLFVGESGSSNSLTVADGGVVAALSITIASALGSSGTLDIGRLGASDAGGSISAPAIVFGAGTGAINFNQRDATTISAAISFTGALNQLGAGTTTLSGDNASYDGTTLISNGTLQTTMVSSLGASMVQLLGGSLELQSALHLESLLWNGSGAIAIPNAAAGHFLQVSSPIILTNGVNYFNLAGASLSGSVKLLSAPNLATNDITRFGVEGVDTNRYSYSLTYTNGQGDGELWLNVSPVSDPTEVEGDWTFIVADSAATITSYSGAGGSVTIPSRLGGHPVISIGVWSNNFPSGSSNVPVFEQASTSLTSVTIPMSMTTIGHGAFAGCSNLTSVTMPDSVTSIGNYAFSDCSDLTSIVFMGAPPSNQPTSIGSLAIIYYLPQWANYWPSIFGGRPTAMFEPQVDSVTITAHEGFHFKWTGSGDVPMNVQSTISLTRGTWSNVAVGITNGDFIDPTPPTGAAFYRAILP
jgi:T5SS/PEP-CTERM-associated repeat protein/autotransporter-associated beta strand protein